MPKNTKALQKNFKSKAAIELQNKELVDENAALRATVSKLLKKIDELQEIDPNSVIERGYTPEQEIIEIQIERLQAVSRTRTLSLDENRALDLLLKNKRMIDKDLKDALDAEFEAMDPRELQELIIDAETDSKSKK